MPKHSNDRLQGTLDLLVLKTPVSRRTMHGYAITLHIEQGSNDATDQRLPSREGA
jgi:DNA-binding PadR family transcriptional regulator